MNNVWIVEMWDEKKKWWVATVQCGLTKARAMIEYREWRRDYPEHRFRVRCYVPKEEKS